MLKFKLLFYFVLYFIGSLSLSFMKRSDVNEIIQSTPICIKDIGVYDYGGNLNGINFQTGQSRILTISNDVDVVAPALNSIYYTKSTVLFHWDWSNGVKLIQTLIDLMPKTLTMTESNVYLITRPFYQNTPLWISSQDGTPLSIIPNAPPKMKGLYSGQKDLVYILSSGLLHSYSSTLGFNLLLSFCSIEPCPLLQEMILIQNGLIFKVPSGVQQGIWKTNGENGIGTSIYCNTSICQNSISLHYFNNMVCFHLESPHSSLYCGNINNSSSINLIKIFTNQTTISSTLKASTVFQDNLYFIMKGTIDDENCLYIWKTDGFSKINQLSKVCTEENSIAMASYLRAIILTIDSKEIPYLLFQLSTSSSVNQTQNSIGDKIEFWGMNLLDQEIFFQQFICSNCSYLVEYSCSNDQNSIWIWTQSAIYSLKTNENDAKALLPSSSTIIFCLISSFLFSFL